MQSSFLNETVEFCSISVPIKPGNISFKVVFYSYASNSKGIAILFSCNSEYECLDDNNGNMLALGIRIDDERLTLACIDDLMKIPTPFYQTRINNEEIIITGDYNMVIDRSIDFFNHLHVIK